MPGFRSRRWEGGWQRRLPATVLVVMLGAAGWSGSTGHRPLMLRDLAQRRGISIGAAARPEVLATDARYRRALAREFNMVTPENAMKWPVVHPGPEVYDFAAADALVAFARRHHMGVHGHNLVTGGPLPDWLVTGTFSRDELIAILHTHIATVVGHFRGTVAQWDVGNELLDFTGNLEDNLWLRGIGPDYLDLAFRWAHEADPKAVLFYNDDDIACDPCQSVFPTALLKRRDAAIYRLVAGMRQRGVPIGGVGIQMHMWRTPPPARDVASFMDRLRGLGLQVAITEMDVRLPDSHTRRDLARQAAVYAQMLDTCLGAPNCKTFVMWGFSDAYSWIPTFLPGYGAGLIFDAQYQRKPAYYALRDSLSKTRSR